MYGCCPQAAVATAPCPWCRSLQREARLAEQQRLLQDDPDVLVPPSEDEEEEPEEAARAQEDAVRNLVQQLRQWPPREGQSAKADAADAEGVGSSTPALPAAEPVPAAPAAAAPPVGSSIDSSAAGAVDIPPLDVVEADYILEERLGQAAGAAGAAVEEEDVPPPVASRCAGPCPAKAWWHCVWRSPREA